MSVANVTAGHAGPEELSQHWEPALTQKEAAKLEISRSEYKAAVLFARMTVEEHQRDGTPRDRWELRPTLTDQLAAPFISEGEQELAGRLEAEVDPALDESQDLIENVKANLDQITEDTPPIVTEEAGLNFSVAEAVERVGQDDVKIGRDRAVGKHHHDPSSTLLQRLATWTPWLEAVGFLTFITYYLNVPLLQPWLNWLAWSFAATVVVVIIVGQTWLVRHAARSHNHARDARADANHHEAARGFTRRNWYVALTALTAVAITCGMIWRGIAALGGASLGTAALLVFVAAVTGLLLPTLAYLGIALDGSKVSRERDGLAADLDDDLDAYAEIIDNSRRDLARVAEIGKRLKEMTFLDICSTTQEAVNAVYRFYGIIRLLTGGLSAEPPSRTTKTIGVDAEGNIRGCIGTSIPGAGNVNLDPLFDRWHRLFKIESQLPGLHARVDALPPHPWGKPRNA